MSRHDPYGPPGVYRFWSTQNCEEDEAEQRTFNRGTYGSTIAHMLRTHAEHQGEAEDYLDRQHPYSVRSPDGSLRRWLVTGETTVVYSAKVDPQG